MNFPSPFWETPGLFWLLLRTPQAPFQLLYTNFLEQAGGFSDSACGVCVWVCFPSVKLFIHCSVFVCGSCGEKPFKAISSGWKCENAKMCVSVCECLVFWMSKNESRAKVSGGGWWWCVRVYNQESCGFLVAVPAGPVSPHLLLLEQPQALQQRQPGPNGTGRLVVQLILGLGTVRILLVGSDAGHALQHDLAAARRRIMQRLHLQGLVAFPAGSGEGGNILNNRLKYFINILIKIIIFK